MPTPTTTLLGSPVVAQLQPDIHLKSPPSPNIHINIVLNLVCLNDKTAGEVFCFLQGLELV